PAAGASAASPAPPAPRPAPVASDEASLRVAILVALLNLCVPVQGPVARYLQKRRIFKRTWDTQRLRMIGDYGATSSALEARFGREALERAGFFNPSGHLRYYRHRLLFPYLDPAGRPVYLQARAIEADARPKELSMVGPIPLPYNVRLLDGEPGQIYLCEGVIDTLTLLEQGVPAVGIPGAANFKPAWVPLFRSKTVRVAFDPDQPGENGAAKTMDLLAAGGVETRRLAPPKGLDLNDWLRSG
ncbi:MAG TPA: toprim domain-containing protein, partial [Fibrobacteria bacterium]|nr:toprim domain-containing protein [Fibrobacteria bacterium]